MDFLLTYHDDDNYSALIITKYWKLRVDYEDVEAYPFITIDMDTADADSLLNNTGFEFDYEERNEKQQLMLDYFEDLENLYFKKNTKNLHLYLKLHKDEIYNLYIELLKECE